MDTASRVSRPEVGGQTCCGLCGRKLLVTWHIRDLRAAIMRFAQGHRASTDLDMSLAPGEIRDATEAFVQLTETIRRDDADLEHALHQKEGLLGEMHHRVKNNLQRIASIISMQKSSACRCARPVRARRAS